MVAIHPELPMKEPTCATAAGRQVLPEEAVQDVAGEVERERFLDRRDPAEVALLARLIECLDGSVRTVDVAFVVLVVVQLHDFARDVGLERAVVIGEIGQNVLGHNLNTPTGCTCEWCKREQEACAGDGVTGASGIRSDG